MHSNGFGGIRSQWMQLHEENILRVGGVELFKDIEDAGL